MCTHREVQSGQGIHLPETEPEEGPGWRLIQVCVSVCLCEFVCQSRLVAHWKRQRTTGHSDGIQEPDGMRVR